MTHVLRVGVVDQIASFQAFNADGSVKTDLTSATDGLTISVFRVGLASVSVAALSNKAADNTPHADGAIRYVGDNDYTLDLPDAAIATQCPHIQIRGTFTGGHLKGEKHPLVGYDPELARVGAPTAIENSTQLSVDVNNEENGWDFFQQWVQVQLAASLGFNTEDLAARLTAINDRTSNIYTLLQLTDADVATIVNALPANLAQLQIGAGGWVVLQDSYAGTLAELVSEIIGENIAGESQFWPDALAVFGEAVRAATEEQVAAAGLALEATLTAARDEILEDIAGIEGSDATLAKQDEIITKLTTLQAVFDGIDKLIKWIRQ